MSFLSVLKGIGHVFNTFATNVVPLEPVIAAAAPGFGTTFNTILNTIIQVEGLVTAAKSGANKKAAVQAIVTANNPTIPSDTLSTQIDKIVAALNALQEAAGANTYGT